MSKLLKSRYTETVWTGVTDIPVQSTNVEQLTTEPPAKADMPESEQIDFEKLQAEASERAERIIAEAEQQAAETLSIVEVMKESTRQQAYEEGFRAGYEEGETRAMEQCSAQCDELIRKAEAIVHRAEAERVERIMSLSGVLANVAMEAVKVLLQRELQTEPADVSSLVENLLKYVIDSTRIEVRVNPSEFDAALAAHPKWKGMKFGDWDIAIVPDSAIEPGGCAIRSDLGRVDARMETKLELLETALRQCLDRMVAEDVRLNA